jgi:proteic killer suppression protein
MIKSFASKETERLFNRQVSTQLPQDIHRIARKKLEILHAAESIQDMRVPPSNRLEKLSGVRKNQYSIRVNDRWRICFQWQGQDAHDVEIVDYH